MTQATAVAADARTSGRRRVLSGFVLFLACLTILVTTVAVWTHQVALNTDRFTSLVSTAVTEPAVTDPIATRITDQVVEALDVQGRLEARLPDAIKPLAGSLEAAVADRIDARLKIALRDPRLQNALIQTVSFSHAQLVRLLRGETDNLSIVDGYLTLDAVQSTVGDVSRAIGEGLLLVDYRTRADGSPVTLCRLNRHHPLVKQLTAW